MMKWYEKEGYDPVFLCSKRVSLRNALDFKFVDKMTDTEGVTFRNAVDAILEGFEDRNSFFAYDLTDEVNPTTKKFIENGIISEDGRIWKNGEIYYSDEKGEYLSINVDDHIRISECAVGKSKEYNRGLENFLYEKIFSMYDVAADKSGHILATNIDESSGGCVYSCILHLPVFETMRKEFSTKRKTLFPIGFTLTELAQRDPLKAFGTQGFYVVSMSSLHGKEESHLDLFFDLCTEFATVELENRNLLLGSNASLFLDDLCKAFGFLSGALFLNYSEAMALLSRIKLGYDLGLCPSVKPEIFLKLIIETTDSHIFEKIALENPTFPVDVQSDHQKIDWYRCKILKDIFSEGVLNDKRIF